MIGTSAGVEPEVLQLFAARGFAVQPRVTVDSPQTLLSLVRAGGGVGVLNAVALGTLDTGGATILDIDGDLVRDVAAYWYDVLLDTRIGRRLYRAVLDAPLPPGAMPLASPDGAVTDGRHAEAGRR